MSLRRQLEFIFNGAAVLRYHTTPPLRPQTDGAHSFGVAWLVYLLTEGSASRNLILAALAHDLAEHATGDLSAMAKREGTIGKQLDALEMVQLKAVGLEFMLTEREQRTLLLADKLEGMMFCIAERRLGNRTAELWYGRYRSYFQENGVGYSELFNVVEELWKEATR